MKRRTCSTLLVWTVAVSFHVPFVLFAEGASAQTCEVEAGDPINVHTGGDNLAVRMAWDRIADVPVVIWNDNATGQLTYRRWAGPTDSDWESEIVVPTGVAPPPIGVTDGLMGLWRMFTVAFDSADEPHVVFTGVEQSGATKLYYVHRVGTSGWAEPVALAEMPTLGNGEYEPWIEADFDSSGRLHVAYHCYGGGSSTPTCSLKIHALYRENGVWTGPTIVFENASGMDMAVGSDDVVNVVTLQGGGNQHQGYYSNSLEGQNWSEITQITDEPPGDCYAGPLSCWPAIATDIGGVPTMAYGVDPDPCCEEVGECHWPNPDDEPTWTDCCGHTSYVTDEGGGWSTNNPVEVLDDVALHASLTEFAIDPTGVKYIFGPNYHRELGYVRPNGTTGVVTVDDIGGGRMFFLHSTATGDGGWLAYTSPINMGVSDTVVVRHFNRTGDCATGIDCQQGMTRVCGLCGTQTCDGNSQWGQCQDEGACYPEVTEACGEDGGTWTCGFDCQWQTCQGECGPGDTRGCGNCGTQECLPDTSWGACSNEGVCGPGETQDCGECGTAECDGSCEWGDCQGDVDCGSAADDDTGGGAGGCDCDLDSDASRPLLALACLAVAMVAFFRRRRGTRE